MKWAHANSSYLYHHNYIRILIYLISYAAGHYGSPDHGSNGGSAGGYGGSYTYNSGRPSYASVGGGGGSSGSGGGGGGHHIEYVPHYASGGGGVGSYYGSGESIPFDLYNKGGHYAGEGGEYSYTTYPGGSDGQHEATHKGYPELSQKALLAKSFLIPLASAAVLGIAAALVSNPLLLQLGTVSGVAPAVVGKRKRRAVQETAERPSTALATTTAGAQTIAYRGHRKLKKGVARVLNVGAAGSGGA